LRLNPVLFSQKFNSSHKARSEFDEKYGSSFVTKKFDRNLEYALTFLCQNLTHLFRLGSHFLMQKSGLKETISHLALAHASALF